MRAFVKKILKEKEKKDFLKSKDLNKSIQLKNDFLIIKNREELFKTTNLALTPIQKKVVGDMVKDGFSSKRLNEVYSNSEKLLTYMKNLCNSTKGKSYEELVKEHDLDKTKNYWVNLYHPKKDESDPIKEFMASSEIANIAAKYLGEIPQVAMLSLLYTPPTTEKSKNSMMWHLDNHHENIVRMFINPYDMSVEHGATMIFPNKYQPKYDYYKKFPYFTDEEAKEFGFDFSDKIDLVGDAGHIYFADSANCFHCGSRSKKDRFVAILTFVPYLHSNKYDDALMRDEFALYKKENEIILNYFKEDNN